MKDIRDEQWSDVCLENDPDIAQSKFMEKLMADKHAPLRKYTARHNLVE